MSRTMSHKGVWHAGAWDGGVLQTHGRGGSDERRRGRRDGVGE